DDEAARLVASRVLERDPGNLRARIIADVAALNVAAVNDASGVAARIDARPELFTQSVAAAISRAFEAHPQLTGRAALLDTIARRSVRHAQLPAPLFALLIEHVAERESEDLFSALLALALARDFQAADHDALRRIAAVAHGRGEASSVDLAGRYGASCL